MQRPEGRDVVAEPAPFRGVANRVGITIGGTDRGVAVRCDGPTCTERVMAPAAFFGMRGGITAAAFFGIRGGIAPSECAVACDCCC